jgi:hypothetical protein
MNKMKKRMPGFIAEISVKTGATYLQSHKRNCTREIVPSVEQGCCYKYQNGYCICSAPVLKKDCPSGWTWKANKNCYESDKTGCCD